TFAAQAQDSRAFDKKAGGQASPFRDTLDVRLLYGEYAFSHASIRVGRQELNFGAQRLIGSLPWTNASRSFDGAHGIVKGRFGQVDGFVASVVTIQADDLDRSELFDSAGTRNLLSGAYASFTSILPKQS